MDYTIVRSRRKTIGIHVKLDGSVVVRAPYRVSAKQIEKIMSQKQEWVEKSRKKLQEMNRPFTDISEEERREGMERAREIIPQRVAYFAERMGVTYGKITIRDQKTRWGSCSSQGNLNFNWKLVKVPKEALDYVVVHELAHRKEMNHSAAFWAVVEKELPDYKERRKMLKQDTKAGHPFVSGKSGSL